MTDPRILTLGLTGGIGSGKSYVAVLLTARGIPVYDSDARAKALYDEDPVLRQALIEHFSPTLYKTKEGKLDRKALAQIIFSDQEKLKQINALVHPAVRRDFVHWRSECIRRGLGCCALESALLLDAGLSDYVDRSIAVLANDTLRLERAMRRDGADASAIQARMRNQMSQEEMQQRCDYVIYNDPTDDLEAQLDTILAR